MNTSWKIIFFTSNFISRNKHLVDQYVAKNRFPITIFSSEEKNSDPSNFPKLIIIGSPYKVPKARTAFQCNLTRKFTKFMKINICLFQAVLLAGDALWTSEMIKKHIGDDTESRKHTFSSKTMFLNPVIFWHAPPYNVIMRIYGLLLGPGLS